MDYRTVNKLQSEYEGPFLSCPLLKYLQEKDKLKKQADEEIITTITQMIPPSSDDKAKTKALLSYIALGGSLLSLGTICYIYYQGPPVAPVCMNDSLINQVYEYCNKFFYKYVRGNSNTSCELEISEFERENTEYRNNIQMSIIGHIGITSLLFMGDKIEQVSNWVKTKYNNSSCTMMGGKRRRTKKTRTRRPRRYAKKKTHRQKYVKKRRTYRK